VIIKLLRYTVVIFILGLVVSCRALAATSEINPVAQSFPVSAMSFQALMDAADKAYADRWDVSQARAAMDLYEKAVQVAPQSPEAYWKISRTAWWLGERAEPKEKAALFQKGIDRAQAAINQDKNSAPAHFWLGVNYGDYGDSRGVLKSLFLIKPIREELETVLKLDPNYEGGGAYRVLGIVDYKVPGFAGGSNKRALLNLKKALEISPNYPSNIYYLAEYYFTVGDKSKAKSELNRLEKLTVAKEELPELLLMQESGRKLKEKIK